ncbi:MAG TPA: HlyD family secretion protein [Sphingomicrobium sp.]|jgi:membrane fusion protein (multidrug efflux system)|nr:HlyD family secretion protein [Sphingomicrobium sp.]
MNKMKTETAERAATPAETPEEAAAIAKETRKARKAKQSRLRTILMLVVPALLVIIGAYLWLASGGSESTDNAQVKTDIVSVTAQVTGPVVEVGVQNGNHVKQGDVLFRIDPAPFRVALEQAEAQLAAARLQTTQLRTQAAGTGADITGAQANLAIKQNALDRQSALLKQGFTTRSDYDDALNEVKTAETQLADARARAANANAAIAPGQQPSIAQAQAAVDKAKLDLERTVVRAPMSGEVANADRLQIGTQIVSGVGAVSIVHSNNAWVEANFKENQLTDMRPGQSVTVKIDAYPGDKFKAHVESIGAGTGSEFSLLPAQNANGNWVKVTQRVPVRIAFDGTPSKPMIAGLSAVVSVDTD